ncbi:MAG TPA: ADYC domain-containing protein [Kofleriaceae bacterium]
MTKQLCVFVFMVGCSSGVQTSTSEQHGRGDDDGDGEPCPPYACSNSDELIHYGMHELNLRGEPNAQGVSLTSGPSGRAEILKNGNSYDLYVENGFIVGKTGGVVTLAGAALEGAQLVLTDEVDVVYTIWIQNVRVGEYPVGDPDPIEFYTMTWVGDGGTGDDNICNGVGSALPDEHELLGMQEGETLVFEGDRIDPGPKTMSGSADDAWFNFGCAGHTLAKLRLTRNTVAHNNDWQGRQATLKLLVADYCGNGTPYTVAGTPLRWRSDDMEYYPGAGGIEARWTKNGAECLSVPRLLLHPSELYEDIEALIAAECSLPACLPDIEDLEGASRISANASW